MNDSESDAFADFILKLRALNITMIIIEHHIPVVLKTCDRVTALNFGQTIACGNPLEVRHNPEVVKASKFAGCLGRCWNLFATYGSFCPERESLK